MTTDTRSPSDIERDIERERAGLTSTLDDLQNKFSVETIARQFTDHFREHGGDMSRSVTNAVKSNPVALALTGVGLAWLMMGDRSGGDSRTARNHAYGRPDIDRSDYLSDSGRRDHDVRDRDRGSRYRQDNFASTGYGESSRFARSEGLSNHDDLPSWARQGTSVSEAATPSKRGGLGSGAADMARTAADTVADTARKTGAAVAGSTKDAAGAAADAGRYVSESAHSMGSAATERAAALRERLAEGTEQLSEAARERVIAARQSAVEARAAAASLARRGSERAADIFEEQPLIAGAIAVALGAALGAALPRSRMEDHYLGEQSDYLISEAERIYAEETAKIGKVAEAATEEARKIATEVKDKADAAAPTADAMVDKAKASGQRIVDAAEAEADNQHLGPAKRS